MALTDLYEQYVFEAPDGPGCGQAAHHADCLCDVDAEKARIINEAPTVVGPLHKLAAQVTTTPSTGVELERWASELLGLAEELERRGKTATFDAVALDECRQRLLLKIQQPGRIQDGSKAAGRYAWQAEVVEMLRAGLTITEIAAYVGVFVEDITRCLNQGNVKTSAYLRAEQLLRSGEAESLGHVAKETGLSRYVVRGLADAIGAVTKVSERRQAGGGDKYTAEQYAEVIRLRNEGVSFGQIEKLTGVGKTAAFRIYKRAAA